MKTKLFSLLFAVVANIGLLHAEIITGNCGDQGDNLTWSFNTEDNTLTVSGEGAMKDSGSQYGSMHTIFYGYDISKENVHHIIINEGVTTIGAHAFFECENITSVSLPNTLTTLYNGAFYLCSGLKSIDLPNSLITIDMYTFYGTGLKSITIPSNVTSIDADAFLLCQQLEKVSFLGTTPPNVYGPYQHSFENYKGIYYVPCGTVEAYAEALYVDTERVSESGVASGRFGDIAPNLDNLTWELSCDGILSIIGYGGMYHWFGDSHAPWYEYRAQIKNVIIGDGVSDIGSHAFQDCNNLKSISIPNTITLIGQSAFSGCSNLTSITIPTSVTSIWESAFANCRKLNEVHISDLEKWFRIKFEGSVYSNPLCYAPHLYVNETEITSVEFPSSIISIGDYAFCGWKNLTSVSIPENVTSIGKYAFWNCSGLTSIKIPYGVTDIGEGAFIDCSSLTSITSEAMTPPIIAVPQYLEYRVFNNVDKSIPLYVPAASISAYQTAYGWKDFTNILPIPGTEPEEPETEDVNCNIRYVDKNSELVSSEQLTFHMPEAPGFEGFTFLRWEFVGGAMSDGLTIQAVYEANEPTSAPEVVNPRNAAQKLIREGNVYILRDNGTYTATGMKVE